MQVWLPESKYADGNRIATFYQQALERIRQRPGVKSASAVNFLPLSGWGDVTGFAVDGRAAPPPDQEPVVQYRVIDGDYFLVMGIPLMKGRVFDERDRDEAHGVTIINETMARRYWPGEDPIGKRIRPSFPEAKAPWQPKSGNPWLTVVGVARDVKEIGPTAETSPEFYLPCLQNPSALMRLVVRADTGQTDIVSSIRREILAVDKDQPVIEIKSMKQFFSESAFRRRFNTILLALFAAVALILAVVGIYGVMGYAVTQRTREVGIRMALGAQPHDVLGLVLRRGLALTVVGVGIGVAGAFALTRLMSGLLFGVSATDPMTFVLIAMLLTAVALGACFVPARKATKVDPMVALRYE